MNPVPLQATAQGSHFIKPGRRPDPTTHDLRTALPLPFDLLEAALEPRRLHSQPALPR